MKKEAIEKGILERGLGWFSVGLGTAQLASPCGVARLAGMKEDDRLMRALGLRELASGLGILMRRRPIGFLWARTLGDIMDLALLGRSMRSWRADRPRLTMAMAAVGGVAVLDLVASLRTSRRATTDELAITKLITIGRTPIEVHDAWRAAQPDDIEIIDERRGELVSWRTGPRSALPHVGVARFTAAPGDRGTEVRVDIHYHAPLGKLGAAAAKLVGNEPGQQVYRDLRHIKQILETGEIVHSDASVRRGMHPARPSREALATPSPSRSEREERMS